MKRRSFVIAVALAVVACSSGSSMSTKAEKRATTGDDRHPVVVELYQSQGCSSCPPANANLNAVAGDQGVLALSFAVTYWDQLGWKDRFARPEFTQRQWDYANSAGRGRVYTPQVIVNGGAMMLGGDKAHFARLLAAGAPRGGPSIEAGQGEVAVGPGKASAAANVWLVRYDPRVREVAIRAGENGGRTLPHRNIVTELSRIGGWNGTAARFAVPPSRDGALRSAVFVQQDRGGPIIAALKI